MRVRARTFLLSLVAALTSAAAYAAPEESCSAAHVRAQVLKRDAPDRLLERRAALQTCSSAQCPRSVVAACSDWLRSVDAVTPSVVVRVVGPQGVAVADASIRVDGKIEAVGVPVDLDPGEHTVAVVAATRTASRSVVLRLGDKERVVEIVLAAEQPSTAKPATPAADQVDKNERSTQRTISYGVGGVGLAAIIAGAVGVGVFKSKYDDAKHDCEDHPDPCGNQRAVDDGKAARSGIIGSDILFVTGALLLTGGVILYFTSPERKAAVPGPQAVGLAVGPSGLSVKGIW